MPSRERLVLWSIANSSAPSPLRHIYYTNYGFSYPKRRRRPLYHHRCTATPRISDARTMPLLAMATPRIIDKPWLGRRRAARRNARRLILRQLMGDGRPHTRKIDVGTHTCTSNYPSSWFLVKVLDSSFIYISMILNTYIQVVWFFIVYNTV
jgi:hypothetical protein